MGRLIIREYDTKEEAQAYLDGWKDSDDKDFHHGINDFFILDDREYNGKWTINIE